MPDTRSTFYKPNSLSLSPSTDPPVDDSDGKSRPVLALDNRYQNATLAPPAPRSIADSRLKGVRGAPERVSLAKSLFVPKALPNGTTCSYSLWELRASSVREPIVLNHRPAEVIRAIPLLAAAEGAPKEDVEDAKRVWELYDFGAEFGLLEYIAALLRGRFEKAAETALLGFARACNLRQYSAAYVRVKSGRCVRGLLGGAADGWTAQRAGDLVNPGNPFARILLQETALLLDDSMHEIVKHVRSMLPEALSQHGIAGLCIQRVGSGLPGHLKTQAAAVLAKIAPPTPPEVGKGGSEPRLSLGPPPPQPSDDALAKQFGSLYASPAAAFLTEQMLLKAGIDVVAQATLLMAGRDPRWTQVPFAALALAACLLECEVVALTQITLLNGVKIHAEEAYSTLSSEEANAMRLHRRLLQHIESRLPGSELQSSVASAVRHLEAGLDIEATLASLHRDAPVM